MSEGILTLFFVLSALALWQWMLLHTPIARRHTDKPLRIALCGVTFLYALLLIRSNAYTQNNDVQQHIQYLNAIAMGHLPNPAQGWESYHPPLYYILAKPFLLLGYALNPASPLFVVRVFSTFCSMVFMLYALGVIGQLVRSRAGVYLAFALLAFWPLALAQSGKINNDVPLHMLVLMGLYHLMQWEKTSQRQQLWYAIIAGCVSVAVKSTGLIFCGVTAIVFLLRVHRKQASFRAMFSDRRMLLLTALIAILCFGMNFGRTINYRLRTDAPMDFLVGNMTNNTTHPNIITYDSWQNFISLQPLNMIKLQSTHKGAIFWNTATKTLLLGEPWWGGSRLVSASIFFYLLLLGYAALSVLWRIATPQAISPHWHTPALLALSSLAGLFYLRISIPTGSSSDARYIFYTVPILASCIIRSMEWHREQQRLGASKLGYILVLGFCLSAGALIALCLWTRNY